MSEQVELLSNAVNYAVVKLPGRKYPGVVFQGDSLHSLVTRLRELKSADVQTINAEVADICEELFDVLVHFEKICNTLGIALPYPKK